MQALTVQIVDRLAGHLGCFAGGVLDGSYQLIGRTLICQLAVPGRLPQTLFIFSGETPAGPFQPLLRTPQSGPASRIFHIRITGRILRAGLVQNNVGEYPEADTHEDPRKSFHVTSLLGTL